MQYGKFGNTYVLRLEKGEEIIESIKSFCKKEKIRSASLSGIGATDNFTVGVFNLKTQKYNQKTFNGNHEINNLCGNITFVNGEPYIHIHITCTDKNFKVKGGHLLQGKISLTAELFIDTITGEIGRIKDENLKINLMKF